MTENEEEENLIGKEFAGCKIISKIGQGGMGTVYKAHHKALNKTVCVKLLDKKLSGDKRNLEFFLREARSAAKLNHPNIVHVYNFGKENGNYFIVMSYIDGKSLQDIVEKEGALPIEKATKFTVELLEGLGHAHSKGVIHRDIKPSNILVGSNGKSYLVDFGLAKSVSEEKELTQAGEMIGTAYFMSPEQCLAQKVDNRADLYAVGATFYYLITGKYPFDGKSSIEVMHKHIGSQVPDPILFNPDVPRWAAVFIEHAMKKKPEDRFQNAEEAKTELLDYSTGKKILPNPGGDIILDLTSQLHNPEPTEILETPGTLGNDFSNGSYNPDAGAPVLEGISVELDIEKPVPPVPPAPPAPPSPSNDGFNAGLGLNIDWNSGEALRPTPPPPPVEPPPLSLDISSADPSMSVGQDYGTSSVGNDYGFNDIQHTTVIEQPADPFKPEENVADIHVEEHLSEEPPQNNAPSSGALRTTVKSVAHIVLLMAAFFFFVLSGASGTGVVSVLNAFATNPGMAAGFFAAGALLSVLAFFVKPARTTWPYILCLIVGLLSAFVGGAYINAAKGSDIAAKLITAVSLVMQNSSGPLMIVYALSSFLMAAVLLQFRSRLARLLSAAFFTFSIWLVFSYSCIGHEFFWNDEPMAYIFGGIAGVATLFAVIYSFSDKVKILESKVFTVAACIAVALMIYLPNVNRAANNEFKKLSDEWANYKAQKEAGVQYVSEPREEMRDLEEFKEDAKYDYMKKEREKLSYAVTDGGGLIVFSLFLALLSTLSLFSSDTKKKTEEIVEY